MCGLGERDAVINKFADGKEKCFLFVSFFFNKVCVSVCVSSSIWISSFVCMIL